MPDRFYCPDPPADGLLSLEGDEARHLSRVLRHVPGDRVEVFDGRGAAYPADVRDVGKDRVVLRIAGGPLPDRSPTREVTLATAIPKGDRFDWLVEKATELGVARLVPLKTERSVVDPRSAKLDRLRRAVVESSKQCGRNRLMALDEPVAWAEYVRRCPVGLRLIAHPGGRPASRWPCEGAGRGAAMAIGPEGGFTGSEIAAAEAAGWVAAGLGPTVLRIETAGLAGCAILLALGETGEGPSS